MPDMGTFRIQVEVENPALPGVRRSRLTRFRQATGQIIERWVGIAIVHVGDIATGDDVVFGEPNDLVLLGSRTLEGLNLTVDPVSKRLVDAGPAPAAVAG